MHHAVECFVNPFQNGTAFLARMGGCESFHLIESGTAVIESGAGLGDPVVIETIGLGDFVGWSWMFPPYLWHFKRTYGRDHQFAGPNFKRETVSELRTRASAAASRRSGGASLATRLQGHLNLGRAVAAGCRPDLNCNACCD